VLPACCSEPLSLVPPLRCPLACAAWRAGDLEERIPEPRVRQGHREGWGSRVSAACAQHWALHGGSEPSAPELAAQDQGPVGGLSRDRARWAGLLGGSAGAACRKWRGDGVVPSCPCVVACSDPSEVHQREAVHGQSQHVRGHPCCWPQGCLSSMPAVPARLPSHPCLLSRVGCPAGSGWQGAPGSASRVPRWLIARPVALPLSLWASGMPPSTWPSARAGLSPSSCSTSPPTPWRPTSLPMAQPTEGALGGRRRPKAPGAGSGISSHRTVAPPLPRDPHPATLPPLASSCIVLNEGHCLPKLSLAVPDLSLRFPEELHVRKEYGMVSLHVCCCHSSFGVSLCHPFSDSLPETCQWERSTTCQHAEATREDLGPWPWVWAWVHPWAWRYPQAWPRHTAMPGSLLQEQQGPELTGAWLRLH